MEKNQSTTIVLTCFVSTLTKIIKKLGGPLVGPDMDNLGEIDVYFNESYRRDPKDEKEYYIQMIKEMFVKQPEYYLMRQWTQDLIDAGYLSVRRGSVKAYRCKYCKYDFVQPNKHSHVIYDGRPEPIRDDEVTSERVFEPGEDIPRYMW